MEEVTKKKVGIYLRLSNEDKDKINKTDISESIKNQRNMLIEYINKNKEFILEDEYCDEDLSGAGTFRPEFERLIKDCEAKKIDVVLCKSQSRFSRDMEIVEKYINNKFKEWNIRFISLADNADTLLLGNKKSRQINGLVNEWFLEDVSSNIRSAFNSKMKAGEFISPFASFGYKISSKNNNKLEVDEKAASVVKKIFKMYKEGLGLSTIAKKLNDDNIPSPSLYKYNNGSKLNIISNKPREDIKWSPSAIKRILTNKLYLGHLIQGKRTTISYKNHKIITKDKKEWIEVCNTHQSIIDKETFEEVNKQLKERTKIIKNTGKIHILSGKIYCNICKGKLIKKNSSRHEYLVCKTYNCQNNKSIRYDDLEKIILVKINEIIKNNYDINILNSLNKHKSNIECKLKLLKENKKELLNKSIKTENYLKQLYKDKVNGIINDSEFIELKTKFNNDKYILGKSIDKVEKEINYYNNIGEEYYNELFKKYKKIDNLSRIIIEEFIDKIYIDTLDKMGNSRFIEINWNF